MKRNMFSRHATTGLAAMALFLATGCATTDTVSSRFPGLEENIKAAKTAGAEVYAPTLSSRQRPGWRQPGRL